MTLRIHSRSTKSLQTASWPGFQDETQQTQRPVHTVGSRPSAASGFLEKPSPVEATADGSEELARHRIPRPRTPPIILDLAVCQFRARFSQISHAKTIWLVRTESMDYCLFAQAHTTLSLQIIPSWGALSDLISWTHHWQSHVHTIISQLAHEERDHV